MSSNQIVVPLRIEAKYFKDPTQVTSPFADFSKLPWNNGTQDINFQQPFISEGVVRQPFEQDQMLPPGLHLHFILPHFLGKHYDLPNPADSSGQTTMNRMPAAPNRWIINKYGGTGTNQWLIQSDYVYSPTDTPNTQTCVIPYYKTEDSNTSLFRQMGKIVPFPDLTQALPDVADANDFQKLNSSKLPLTIAGYGDANFSSFYPNCKGAFGFHDGLLIEEIPITYQVIGWVSNTKEDFLPSQIQNILTEVQADLTKQTGQTPTDTQIVDLFNTRFQHATGISLTDYVGNAVSTSDTATLQNLTNISQTVYYGLITVNVDSNGYVSTQPPKKSTIGVSVGQTGTEALSAWIATQLSSQSEYLGEVTASDAKSSIEEQLESVLLRSKLDSSSIDAQAKLAEARHEKGFKPIPGHQIWKIKTENNEPSTNKDAPTIPPLPDGLAPLLTALNSAQKAYDLGNHEVLTLQEQLHADWTKYMQARYPVVEEGPSSSPDADKIQFFLSHASYPALAQLMTQVGEVVYTKNKDQLLPSTQSAVNASLAHDVIDKWQQLDHFLQIENGKRVSQNQPSLYMALTPGPGYWEAKAPTVLFTGLTAENNPPALLQVQLVSSFWGLPYIDPSIVQVAHAPGFTSLSNPDYQYVRDATDQQWNPFILDWTVDLYSPTLKGQNLAFEPGALNDQFQFNVSSPDLQLKSVPAVPVETVISGSVMMSGHAKTGIQSQIESFFKETFRKEKINFPTSSSPLSDFFSPNQWSNALAVLELTSNQKSDPYFGAGSVAAYSNPYFTLWMAYKQLDGQHVLSQTLDGFKEACLMKRKQAQLPIAEPIGFDYEQKFSSQIKEAVGFNAHATPMMAFIFNPIYTGALQFNQLSLIDNFGVPFPLDIDSSNVTYADTIQGETGMFLSPRLAQGARLNLRWLAASGSDETNDSPETSPICGWLVPDFWNYELMVYDHNGNALGYFSQIDMAGPTDKAIWNSVPWARDPIINFNQIGNATLQSVVQQIAESTNAEGSSTSYLSDLLTATQHAQDNISPVNANLHDIKAILMGRPMAVVKCGVSLESKGRAALDQGWAALLGDIQAMTSDPNWSYEDRSTANWDKILFPCKLGEYKLFDDGLIGYWKLADLDKPNAVLNAQEMQSTTVSDSDIKGDKGNCTENLIINAPPTELVLLMDPRGVLHGTTGMLPTKNISIPAEHYLPAMKKIKMWFKTSPILQPAGSDNAKVPLDVPKISGYKWEWWDPYQGQKEVSNSAPTQHQHEASKLIEGWLTLNPQSKEENSN